MLPIWMDSWSNGPGSDGRFYENWKITPAIRRLKQEVVGAVSDVLWVVMGTIGLVMLIACANVTNLLLQRHEQEPLWLSIAAGAVGGLVASFAMNQFHAAAEAVSKAVAEPNARQQAEKGEDATVKTAEAISKKALDHDLSEDEKQWAGPSIQYALGTALGAAYGALAPVFP